MNNDLASNARILAIGKFFMILLCIPHWLACVWIIVADGWHFSNQKEVQLPSWLTQFAYATGNPYLDANLISKGERCAFCRCSMRRLRARSASTSPAANRVSHLVLAFESPLAFCRPAREDPHLRPYSLYMAYAGLSGLGYPDVLLTHEIEMIARSNRAGQPRARPLPRGPSLHCP